MSEVSLTKARIHSGIWEGVLGLGAQTDIPQLEVTHLGKPVSGLSVETDQEHSDQHLVRVPIPAELLADGVQTFVISAVESGEKLAHFSVITGQPVGDDVIAEMDLLRAELDMLKRAFRKHCLETM